MGLCESLSLSFSFSFSFDADDVDGEWLVMDARLAEIIRQSPSRRISSSTMACVSTWEQAEAMDVRHSMAATAVRPDHLPFSSAWWNAARTAGLKTVGVAVVVPNDSCIRYEFSAEKRI